MLLSNAKDVQLPLKLFNLEGRYASALFSAATKRNRLSAVESDVQKIKGSISSSNPLKRFLLDTSQRRDQKCKAVLSMLAGNNYDELTQNFFRVIAENGRLPLTMKIIEGFEALMRAHRSEVPVTITSAQALGKEFLDKLKNVVSNRMLAADQVAKVSTRVDPKILGGVVLEVGDKTVDLSVASRVRAINNTLRGTE